MEERRLSYFKKSLLVLTTLMLFSMFSAVSAHAAATTATAAYNTYKSILSNQQSKYGSFGILYLNNDSIPDMVAVGQSNNETYLVFYINGERVYPDGHSTYVTKSDPGMPLYYYQKKNMIYNTYQGNGVYQYIQKINNVYDMYGVLYSSKTGYGQFAWSKAANNPKDPLRGMSYKVQTLTTTKFNNTLKSFVGSTSATKVVFYGNNANSRNTYLKEKIKKSQSISTPKTSYYATYKKNGTFSLNASAKTTLSYSSANKSIATVSSTGKVTIKGYGVVAITIKAKATTTYKSASKTVYVYVKPVKMKITSLKKGGTGKFVIEWTKDTKVTGYQIQYSLSSSFSSPVTLTSSSYKYDRATINTKAKGTKLYVRIRAYKTMNGKTAYGPWSAVKTVTTGK